MPIPRIGRILGTLAFAFYPIYIWTDCTFMTEPHFLCLTDIAIYCYARALRDESVGFLIGGCVAVALSWWVLPLGFGIGQVVIGVCLARERSERWL